jgi:phosphopantothenoylcysteine decarboxylase/phosphopantothenate--cysteine ligase
VAHAREKLEKKGCDLLVANDVSQPGIGFDSDRNAVMLFFADGRQESLSERPKSEIGQIVVEIVESLVEGRRHHVRQS